MGSTCNCTLFSFIDSEERSQVQPCVCKAEKTEGDVEIIALSTQQHHKTTLYVFCNVSEMYQQIPEEMRFV